MAHICNIHKPSWAKSIIKNGKWYLLSSVFAKGINLFLLPIYSKYLSLSDYGVLESLNSVALLLPIFISLHLDSAFVRYFHDYKCSHEKLQRLFSTVFWFVLMVGSVVVILTVVSANLWMKRLLGVSAYPYALLAFVSPLFLQLGVLGTIFLRQSLQAKKTAFIEIISAVIVAIITVPLLVECDMGAKARLLGGCASAAFLFIFYTIYFVKSGLLIFKLEKRMLVRCLAYSVPLIPEVAGGWIAGLSDRLVIAAYAGVTATGLYSFAYRIAYVLYIVQDAITQVVGPISMSGLIHDKHETKRKIAQLSLSILVLMLMAHLMLTMFSREIFMLFGNSSYSDAYKLVAPIAFIYVLSSQYRLFSSVVQLHKKTWLISFGAILQGIVNLGLNLIFVPLYGYYAAIVVTILSVGAYALWIFVWSQRLDRIALYWNQICVVFLVYIAALLGFYNYRRAPVTLSTVAIKCMVISIIGIVFYYVLRKKIALRMPI